MRIDIARYSLLSLSLFALTSCTDPGRKTGIGAAAGGVVGAGLGAIIGSQTGDAGTGLAIGAVAGSAGGALIANSIEARDKEALAQKQRIRAHQKQLALQKREIDELRQGSIAGDPTTRASRFPDPNQSLSFKYRKVPAAPISSARLSESSSYRAPVLDRSDLSRRGNVSGALATRSGGFAERNISQQNPERSRVDSVVSERRDESAKAQELPRGAPIQVSAPVEHNEESADRLPVLSEQVDSLDNSKANQGSAKIVQNPLEPVVKPKLEEKSALVPPKAELFEGQSEVATSEVEKGRGVITSGAVIEREIPVAKVAQPVDAIPAAPAELEQETSASQAQSDNIQGETVDTAKVVSAPAQLSDSCRSAQDEVTKANASKEHADKLFFYRRALRLCPEGAAIHNGLGEVYKSLNRTVDAEFEFREALRLDPNFTKAQENLSGMK